MTVLSKDDQTAVLQELTGRLSRNEKPYDADGTPTLTVKLADGTFRKKPAAQTAYYLADAYMGSREAIFCLTPEDPQEWAHVEVGAGAIDDVFPLLTDDVKDWAKVRFMPGDASRGVLIDAESKMPGLIARIFAFTHEDNKRAEEADDGALIAHPNFGLF